MIGYNNSNKLTNLLNPPLSEHCNKLLENYKLQLASSSSPGIWLPTFIETLLIAIAMKKVQKQLHLTTVKKCREITSNDLLDVA